VIGYKKCAGKRYGLDLVENRSFNCGCLVSDSGAMSWHEKLDLVPFKESLPWYLDFDWFRDQVLPKFRFEARMTPGNGYGPLTFETRNGSRKSIAVSVCYESFNPGLPQYSKNPNVDAVVHLVYDGHYAENTGMMERQLLACRYRAIETRKWNLVCSTVSGTSMIDPAGRVVRRLDGVPGILSVSSVNAGEM
jgi:apolipoprotein N-acyltransferase